MIDQAPAALVAAARTILSRRRPLDEVDLLDALEDAGVDLNVDYDGPLSDLLDDDDEPIQMLADDRLAWIPAVLDGRVFTHRLSAVEADHDVLPWLPDLAPLATLTTGQDFGQLADGAPITEAFAALGDDFATRGVPETVDPGGGVLFLPPGRFAELGANAGDLVGLRVTPHGFAVEKVAETTACDAGAALKALVEDHPDRPELLDVAVWTICADDDGLFRRPAAPLGDLLTENGLVHDRGGRIGSPDFDFDAWSRAQRIESLQRRYELAADEAAAVIATITSYERTRRNDSPPPESDRATVAMSLGFLAEPVVAAAVLEEIGCDSDGDATALRTFTEEIEPIAPRSARPALRWLRANALEALGDIAAAEATLESAESLDSSWPLTLVSLARYASDRGDAGRGLSLLRRAGMPDDHTLVVLLQHFRPTPRTDLGRNERCWCGSGRKYKVCHLNREELPLADRAAWLYQKSSFDLAGGPFMSLLLQAALRRAMHWELPDSLRRALDEGLVSDTVLFEGGAFEDFLARRGHLLPDDERLLAGQWLLTERSVHEVVTVRRGEGMTLRDVRTGDVHEVLERAASNQVTPGELYCARVVPAGETMQIFGGLQPVALAERDALIALLDNRPGPIELVAFLSGRFEPDEDATE